MQKIEFANKISTSNKTNQKTEQESKIVVENLRKVKGAGLATSRNVFRLLGADVYYVQSERSDNIYYFCKFKPDVFEWYCSCKDNSTRHLKCKHLFAIEFAIKWRTIKDIDKIPSLSTTISTNNELGQTNLSYDKLGETNNNTAITNKTTKSYLEDDYDF